MKKYEIEYQFDGNGVVYIEARNEDEAREKFFCGEFQEQKESGTNYEIISILYEKS